MITILGWLPLAVIAGCFVCALAAAVCPLGARRIDA